LGGADVGAGADLSSYGLATLPIGPSSGGGALSSTEEAAFSPTLTTIPGTGGYSLVSPTSLPSTATLLATTAAGAAASIAQQAAAKQTLANIANQPQSQVLAGIPNAALYVGGAVLVMLLASKGGKRR